MTEFQELPVDAIMSRPSMALQAVDEAALQLLKASVAQVGVLQPIDVRETGGGRYELLDGRKRLRAAREAGLKVIPAVVRRPADDAMIRDVLRES